MGPDPNAAFYPRGSAPSLGRTSPFPVGGGSRGGVAQELRRHSDVRLTMKICTDASKLPLAEGVAALPSLEVEGTQNGGGNEGLKVAS